MEKPGFKDKFIAFIDILGFKDMVEATENGVGRSFDEIQALLTELGREKDKDFFAEYGPQICPESAHARKDLDFQITQVSDCAIASCEVSPAGAINIINHCWGAAIVLLTKGILIRGYITRGSIYHHANQFMGTGYHAAYEREANVTSFKRQADEKGTPFVEIDPVVCEYIRDSTDKCVKDMFKRYVKSDGDLTAIFPFQVFSHSFVIGGYGAPPFDPAKEKKNNENVRVGIRSLKERVMQYADPKNEKAMKKIVHYIAALDEQLSVCDKTDKAIDVLCRPFPARFL